MVHTLLICCGACLLAVATSATTAGPAQAGVPKSPLVGIAAIHTPTPSASPATDSNALILAVLTSSSADGQSSPALQLALIQEDKHWWGLDLASRRDDTTAGHTVASPGLAEFARVALGNVAIDLDHWWLLPRAGSPIMRRARAVIPATWACLDGWAIELEADPAAPHDVLLAANQPIEASHFSPGKGADLSAPRWQSLRQSWQREENWAIQQWSTRTMTTATQSDPARPGIATDTAWRDGQSSQLELGPGSGRLLHLSALRSLISTGIAEPCTQPTAVYSALLHASDQGDLVLLDQNVEVQNCAEGWSPWPRTSPWALLDVHGQRLLAQWRFGLESQILALYALDPATLVPDPEPVAEGASSGC